VYRERVGLDAIEDDAAIGEQLLARLREAVDELGRTADRLAEVLVVGRPAKENDLQVLVVDGRAADEGRLVPRMAFEVEDLLAPIADLDERVARVVLRHLLARLRRHAEPEHARPGVTRRKAHAHRR